MPSNLFLAAALAAAGRGLMVFPVIPGKKIPAIRDWQNRATTDQQQIRKWWAEQARNNIGIATGPSGLLVIDLDPSPTSSCTTQREEILDSLKTLKALADARHHQLPTCTYTVCTQSGGRHLYFRQPQGAKMRNTQGALGERIDTRGYGGYVLAAGSRGPDGRRYSVLHDFPVASLPAWLQRELTDPPIPRFAPARPHEGAGSGLRHLPTMSGTRVRAYVGAVVDGETRAVAAALVGSRHTTLLRAARRLGRWVGSGVLDQATARAALTAAASGFVGVAGYTANQVDRDITDGLTYGAALPHYSAPRRATAFPAADRTASTR